MPGQTTTTSNSAPAWALPYWGSYLGGVADLTQKPLQQYQGPQVADFSPAQYEGMDMIADRARNGGALKGDIQSALKGMFGGGSSYGGGGGGVGGRTTPPIQLGKNPLLQSNPYLDQMIARTGNDVARDYATGTAAQNDARAARAGAFGGSAYEEVNRTNAASLADRLAGAALGARYQDFGDRRQLEEAALARQLAAEQTRMQASAQKFSASAAAGASRANAAGAQRLDALRLGMQLDDSDYKDAHELMGVGGLQQMYGQRLIDADMGRFNEARDYPWQQTDRFGQAISRASGGQGTQIDTKQTDTNPWASALGGGLSLAALYALYGQGK